jgi:phosphate transport system substrate-binding protein
MNISPRTLSRWRPTPALFAAIFLGSLVASAAAEQSRDGLVVQQARNLMVQSRGKHANYDPKLWDLSVLPEYQPGAQVTGTLRLWGNNYIADSNLSTYWEEAFKRYHPGVRFDWSGLKSALVATAGLVTGQADIAANRHITFAELEGFERMFSYDPLQITMARGSADIPGWMTTFCVFVNKANPISGLTMKQLDGIYGTARDGGWEGTTWHPEAGRSARENIRTWGQLGLTGAWKNRPIHVYGLNLRYNNCDMFERAVFHGGDKWNENLREYANYSRPDGSLAIAANVLMKDLDDDPDGIAWSGLQNLTAKTKALPIADHADGPYVPLNIQTVHDRSYPLAFDMFFYLNRKPGQPLDPKVREFVRFVLSREGQEAVARDGKYLPLTPEVVQSELRKLD